MEASSALVTPFSLKESINHVEDAVDVRHSRYRIGSTSNSVDEDNAVMASKRALHDAIGKLVRAQDTLKRPLTDEDGVAWQILDDAIGHLIRREYPLRDLL